MEYESNETLGGIVNRTKALLLVKNKEDDALNPTTTQDRHQKKEKKQNHNDRESEHLRIVAQRRWATVLVTLAVLFFVIQSSLVFVINYAIHPSVPTPNTDKLFGEFQLPLADIVQDTVPFVQDWFQKRQTGVMKNPSKKNGDNMVLLDNAQVTSTASIPSENTAPLTNVTNTSFCLEFYFQGMKEFIPTTSPSYVRLVLQNFGGSMYRSPRIQEALHDLLTEPQDLQAMYEESQKCLSDNQPFVALACVASDFVAPPNLTDVETQIIFQYLVNFSAVLEALTMFLEKDFQALNEMVEAMVTSRRKEFELYVEEKYAENSADYEFYLAKYQTMSMAAQSLLDSMAQNRIPKKTDYDKLVQLNILEAVKLDLKYKREENARAGLALAATAKVGTYFESHEVLTKLSKEWIDAYIAWNFVFVLTSATAASDRLGKLLIPSISCTGDLYVKERFIQRRVISLALSLVHMYAPPQDVEITRTAIQDTITPKEASILQLFYDDFGRENTMFSDDEHPLAGALGQSNIENIILTDPDQETVWKMLYNVCGEICHGPSWKITDSGLTSILFDETDDFYIYLGFINWISVVCTGIGLEVFMVLFVLKNGWTTAHEKQWKVAQFLFPILALVTLGLASARNYLSLLTLVIGCWKVRVCAVVRKKSVPLY